MDESGEALFPDADRETTEVPLVTRVRQVEAARQNAEVALERACARISELEEQNDELRSLVRDFVNKYGWEGKWPLLFMDAHEALSGGDEDE